MSARLENGIEFMVKQMQAYTPVPSTRDGLRLHVAELRKTLSQRQVASELGISRSKVFNLHHEYLAMQKDS